MQGVGEMCVEGEGAGGKTWTDWLSCFTTVRTVFFEIWSVTPICYLFEISGIPVKQCQQRDCTLCNLDRWLCENLPKQRPFSILFDRFVHRLGWIWCKFTPRILQFKIAKHVLPSCFPHWACQSDLPIGEHQWCSCSCCSLWDYSWEAVKLPCF